MRATDIIEKKKTGNVHTYEELKFLVDGYLNGTVEEAQMSAWLMAVCFRGLNFDETVYLTDIFIKSGDVLDFSNIEGHIADKHSTGGVGDKVTLVLIPILASLGVKCAKLSGRGLGMTGGTIDKFESIPNFNCMLSEEDFISKINTVGAAISAQTPNLVPADGKIYALRDVTSTVDNMSLIAASVVSKKIASGADVIVLDVKYGSGAFIKTLDEAKILADLMVKIGQKLGRRINAVISSMEQPLGRAVGNSLEVIEAIDFLKGKLSYDLYEITLEIAAKTLILSEVAKTFEEAKKLVDASILQGKALQKFKEIIASQGGNPEVVDNYKLLPMGEYFIQVKANKDMGYVKTLDALKVAHACKLLGAGRDKKSDKIDFGAGCTIGKKKGNKVKKGDTLITLYYNQNVLKSRIEEAANYAYGAYTFSEEKVQKERIVANMN